MLPSVMSALDPLTKPAVFLVQAPKEVKAWAVIGPRTPLVSICFIKTHKRAGWHGEHPCTQAWNMIMPLTHGLNGAHSSVTWCSPSPFQESCSLYGADVKSVWGTGFAFVLVECHEVPAGHSSGLSRSLWVAAHREVNTQLYNLLLTSSFPHRPPQRKQMSKQTPREEGVHIFKAFSGLSTFAAI